jgi:hypothetical protein
MRDLKNPMAPTFNDEPPKKKVKNYNYQAKADKELEENPTALGRLAHSTSREIEQSFGDKRKEWSTAYNKGQMTKRAYKDSVASTLAPGSKVSDYTEVSKTSAPPKKVRWYIGNEAAPIASWETRNVFGGGTKNLKKK